MFTKSFEVVSISGLVYAVAKLCMAHFVVSVLPVKLETRKVGIENSWYLHWEGPEEKKEIEAMVADFDQSGSTSYIIRGYYVVAQEKTGRHINHQESAFSANTTVDLEYMFPKFNNKFQNVSFDVSTHTNYPNKLSGRSLSCCPLMNFDTNTLCSKLEACELDSRQYDRPEPSRILE